MLSSSNFVPPPVVLPSSIKAEPIKIHWDPSLPVFAKEEFLRAVGDEYGWLGGLDESGTLRCTYGRQRATENSAGQHHD